jgi:lysophospholipase L1-like esterase
MTILAFGDSITEGEVPVAGEFPIQPRFVEPDHSYPADLRDLLDSRYAAQGAVRVDAFMASTTGGVTDCTVDQPLPTTTSIVVINAGCLGESAEDPKALSRLQDKLAFYNPDLVLLLEGTNDLSDTDPTSVTRGLRGVQTLLAEAQRHHPVLVGTIPPQVASEFTHGGAADLVGLFNAQLVTMVRNAGAGVVDLYGDLATDTADWISPYDGLHPTHAGYQEIARVWFNAIRGAFDTSGQAARNRQRR